MNDDDDHYDEYRALHTPMSAKPYPETGFCMSLKPTIHEYCKQCGQKDAEIRGSTVWSGLHMCPKAPPGPSNPPHDRRLSEVVFVSGKDA